MDEELEEVTLNFMIEIYVPGHEGALAFPWALTVNREVTDMKEVMDYAHMQLKALMSEQHRMTIVDTRYNHHIIQWDKVAAVSILAPDAESLPWSEAVT